MGDDALPPVSTLRLRALTHALAAGGEEAKRAFQARMKKIDVASIKAARRWLTSLDAR
jgi:hypothetical protein